MKKSSPEDTAKAIGARIRAAIDSSKYGDIEAFAKAIGRTPDAVYKVCRGESLAQAVQLISMARALDLTPNDLLGVSSGEQPSVAVEGFVGAFQAISHLTEAQSRRVVESVLELIKDPPVRSADPASVYRDRGAVEARRLLNAEDQ